MSLADSGELFHNSGHEDEIQVGDLEDRFLAKKQELEVDKYFRALVKLEGSDLHMKVGQPPIVRVQRQAQAAQSRPDRIGGDVPSAVPDDEQAASSDLRQAGWNRLCLHGRRGWRDVAFSCQHADADGKDRPGRSAGQQLDSRLCRPASSAHHGGVCASTIRA